MFADVIIKAVGVAPSEMQGQFVENLRYVKTKMEGLVRDLTIMHTATAAAEAAARTVDVAGMYDPLS